MILHLYSPLPYSSREVGQALRQTYELAGQTLHAEEEKTEACIQITPSKNTDSITFHDIIYGFQDANIPIWQLNPGDYIFFQLPWVPTSDELPALLISFLTETGTRDMVYIRIIKEHGTKLSVQFLCKA